MSRIQNSLRGLLFKDVALDLTIRAVKMCSFSILQAFILEEKEAEPWLQQIRSSRSAGDFFGNCASIRRASWIFSVRWRRITSSRWRGRSASFFMRRSRASLMHSNFAHQKRSTDLENTDFMPMKILPLCTFS